MKNSPDYSVSISSRAFNDVYRPFLDNTSRVQIIYGGSSSGKSVFIAQRAVWDVQRNKRNYLVCRAVGQHSRRSTFAEIKKVIAGWGLGELFKVNQTELTITCINGYQILFTGLDDLENLKSITPQVGAITDIWVEEATQIERDAIKHLVKRQRGGDEGTPKRLTLSFNPIYKTHWIYQDYFAPVAWADDQTEYQSPELSILKTWYIHNRFLTDADVKDLLGETDDYYRSVYTLGNWGVLGDVIFRNWTSSDLSEMRAEFTNPRNGLDFGFSSDPAAVAQSHYDKMRKTIYVFGELYERGLTNDLLAIEIKRMIGQQYIYCDSAEPKSIAELRNDGVSALAVSKGKDSILFGIQWLQQQTIIIDKMCVNLNAELSVYHWKKDKDGNALRKPSEKLDHLIDALRYAFERDSVETPTASQLVSFA